LRVVVQRVGQASVEVEGETVGEIGAGLLVLVGFRAGDDAAALDWTARKLLSLRLFEDDQGKMNLSVTEIGGEALLVPQFTLYADCRQGRRPSFSGALGPEEAAALFDQFCGVVEEAGLRPHRGVFGAHMKVSLVNDGPVTLIVDSP
jgi:D-tyrosyl-tRNA(Tyr) deacylase